MRTDNKFIYKMYYLTFICFNNIFNKNVLSWRRKTKNIFALSWSHKTVSSRPPQLQRRLINVYTLVTLVWSPEQHEYKMSLVLVQQFDLCYIHIYKSFGKKNINDDDMLEVRRKGGARASSYSISTNMFHQLVV